jgi:hypothetical protein
MFARKCGYRLGICSVVLGAVYLGLAHPALAWDQPLWVQQLGTPEVDGATGVATDRDGNVYVSGWTWGSLGGPHQRLLDAWVAKYSAAGGLRWKRQFEMAEWDHATGVAADRDGNVYVSGYSEASPRFAWVAKYSAAGGLRWKRQLEHSMNEVVAVAIDRDGNVYVTGTGYKDWDYTHAWVAKYSAAGGLRWKRQLATTEGHLSSGGVAIDRDGNVYLTGTGYKGDYTHAWIAKYSAAGGLRWNRQVATGGGGNEAATGVATDAAGDVYITGWASLGDAWLAKYSAAGGLRWKRRLGTAESDGATGVATDRDGNVYVSGATEGSLGAGAWLAKYSAAGGLRWKRQFGTESDGATGVATDRDGNVYVSGWTWGSLGGPNQGYDDAWVAKYSTQR